MKKIAYAVLRGNNIIFISKKSEQEAQDFRNSQLDVIDLVLAYRKEEDSLGTWRIDALYRPEEGKRYILCRESIR